MLGFTFFIFIEEICKNQITRDNSFVGVMKRPILYVSANQTVQIKISIYRLLLNVINHIFVIIFFLK